MTHDLIKIKRAKKLQKVQKRKQINAKKCLNVQKILKKKRRDFIVLVLPSANDEIIGVSHIKDF